MGFIQGGSDTQTESFGGMWSRYVLILTLGFMSLLVFPRCFCIFIKEDVFIQSQVIFKMDRVSHIDRTSQNNSEIQKLTACYFTLVSIICVQIIRFFLKVNRTK